VRARLAALVICLVASPAAAGTLDEASRLLDDWDPVAAELRLADAEAAGEAGDRLTYLKVRLRLLQGAYGEAVELLTEIQAFVLTEPGAAHTARAAVSAETEVKHYTESETPDGHWLIRHKAGKDAVLVPLLRAFLPRIRQRLGDAFGVFPDHPVILEIYPETAALARVTGLKESEIEASGTIAIAKYNRLMITSPSALHRGYGWVQTIAHEYIHMLVNKKAGKHVPIWLHEGIAKYHETYWDSDIGHALNPAEESIVAVALRDKQLITFDEMSPSMALLPTQRHTALAFAEVQTVIQFLLEKHGADSVQRVLEALGSGQAKDEREALKQVTRLSFKAFERNWRSWLKRRRYRVRKDAGIVEMRFKKSDRDPKKADLDGLRKEIRDFVHLGDLLRGKDRHKAGLKEYRKALAKAGGGQDALVRARIASAHLALDQPQPAIDAVAGVPDLHPGHMMSYVLLGEGHLKLGAHPEARRWLGRALRYNPYDVKIHADLKTACDALGDEACANRAAESIRILQGSRKESP
jgi:tetratricopeptide (TPR) repeat protein